MQAEGEHQRHKRTWYFRKCLESKWQWLAGRLRSYVLLGVWILAVRDHGVIFKRVVTLVLYFRKIIVSAIQSMS